MYLVVIDKQHLLVWLHFQHSLVLTVCAFREVVGSVVLLVVDDLQARGPGGGCSGLLLAIDIISIYIYRP